MPDMIEIQVDVTADDIAQGTRYHATDCPWNRALARALAPLVPEGMDLVVETSVAFSDIWVRSRSQPSRLLEIKLPSMVYSRIDRYDGGGSMEPFTTIVSVPASLFTPEDMSA